MKYERPYVVTHPNKGFVARLKNRRISALKGKSGWLFKMVNCLNKRPNEEAFDSVVKRCGRYVTEKTLHLSDEAYSILAAAYYEYNKQSTQQP